MKTKLLLVVALTALLMLLCANAAYASAVRPLMAGQSTQIGTVTVTNTASQLTVKYQITASGWSLTATHLYVGTTPPAKSAPGLFPYAHNGLHATQDTYTVPVSAGAYYIAAHAVVQNQNSIVGGTCPTVEEITAALPTSGDISLALGSTAHFNVTITNGGILNGVRAGWCLDRTHGIALSWPYLVNFYSTLAPIPALLTTGTDPAIDYPGNVDLVNWAVNNRDGYTRDEVQNVIWYLIESAQPTLTAHEQTLADAAAANGEGFVPQFANGDVYTIIAAPVNADGTILRGQVILIEFPVPCTPVYSSETAWATAAGDYRWSTGWGTYFRYIVSPAP